MKTSVKLPRKVLGFSLVEVTLAMGIASLGLLTILGLMPQGLEMSRKTGQIVSERHLVEQIIRNLEQTSWNLVTVGDSMKYYDDQGVEVQSANELGRTFSARVEVASANLRMPGAKTDETALKKVTIKVTSSPQRSFDFSEANSRNYRTFVQYIAKGR